MKTLLCFVLSLACCAAIVVGVHHASADSGAPVAMDAGVGSATSAAPAPATPVHDPSTDPAGFIADLKDAKKQGWPLAILVGMTGLVELLAALGKQGGKLAALGKGRVSIVIGGASAILISAVAALGGGAAWTSVAFAAGAALLAYWHQAGTDPAKA